MVILTGAFSTTGKPEIARQISGLGEHIRANFADIIDRESPSCGLCCVEVQQDGSVVLSFGDHDHDDTIAMIECAEEYLHNAGVRVSGAVSTKSAGLQNPATRQCVYAFAGARWVYSGDKYGATLPKPAVQAA